MKYPIARILLVIPVMVGFATFSSCIKENNADCPTGPVVSLRFSFTHHNHTDEPTDLFAQWVDDLDVFLFDGAENFYAWIPVSRSLLADGNTLNIEVEPGEYKIVAWGNLTGGSYGVDADEQTPSEYTVSVRENHPQVADLFHGITELTVFDTNISQEVPLIRNTHIVRVYIAGLSENTRSVPGSDFAVRIEGSNTQYNFENNPVAEAPAPYIPTYSTLTYAGKTFDLAEFKVHRLYVGDDVKLNISLDGTVRYEENLTSRILSAYEKIVTTEDLDRQYEYELFYELDEQGRFVFIGTMIKDWENPSMPGDLR